uniref:Uncharacterized protein n=1 Tax=Oryza brachyantha TaxID=4533 RepID=J3L4L1_ORYBR
MAACSEGGKGRSLAAPDNLSGAFDQTYISVRDSDMDKILARQDPIKNRVVSHTTMRMDK